eukprot:scaffold4470_cov255-Prasinococcus_capsulatus_cf.AAC.21
MLATPLCCGNVGGTSRTPARYGHVGGHRESSSDVARFVRARKYHSKPTVVTSLNSPRMLWTSVATVEPSRRSGHAPRALRVATYKLSLAM